jgi:hypothetical protein
MATVFRKGDRVCLTKAARATGRRPAGLGTVCRACNPTGLSIRVLWDGWGSRAGLYCERRLLQVVPKKGGQ